MKSTRVSLLLISLVLASALLLSACSTLGLVFSGNKITVNVNMTESQVNELLANSTSQSNDKLLDEVTSVDMQDGQIRVFGTENVNGAQVNGSYDVSMGQTGGDLWVRVVAVDIPGKDMNDPSITSLNNRLARDFTQMAVENQGNLNFQKVTITPDALQMVIEVTIDK